MKQSKETNSVYISNPFTLIFKGFEQLFKYNQTMSIIILVCSFFGFLGNFNYNFSSNSNSVPVNSSSPSSLVLVTIVIGMLSAFLAIFFINTIYQGMVAFTAVQTGRQKTVTFKEAFRASLNNFWTVFRISVVVFFKVLGGLFLFIVPGIRAALRYQLVYMPVFEEEADVKTAIKRSKELTKNHLIEVFGMTFAAGIIPLVGGLMNVGGITIMYPQLKALKASNAPKPKVHWLNYLGFIFVGFIIILISLIGLLIIKATN